MKKLIIALLTATVLAGCAAIKTPFDKGYEFGDTTESLLALQVNYCTETAPTKRAVLLVALRSAIPGYPVSGACSQVATKISEKLLEDTADSETYEQYLKELEQAKKDAEAFEGKVDGNKVSE